MKEKCFSDIHNIGAGNEWVKAYCRVKFNNPDATSTAEVKTMWKIGSCYKCRGLHFLCNCTNNSSKKSLTKTPTTKPQRKQLHKFHNNKSNDKMFPSGTLSFKASQPIRSSNNMLVSIGTIQHILGKTAERYSFKKKSDGQHDETISTEPSVNEVMETIMAGQNDPYTQDPTGHVTDEDCFMNYLTSSLTWYHPYQID